MSSSVISHPAKDCPWKRTRLRVPAEDGQLFADPSFEKGVQQAKENQTLFDQAEFRLLGEPLAAFRIQAREEVINAAHQYTKTLTGSELCSCFQTERQPITTLFVGGHQPALFHPGVWVKNFGINSMAQQAGGTALNLVVDNDILTSTALNVPTGTRDNPAVEAIPFDNMPVGSPWEEVEVNDRELFASFADRVSNTMTKWGIQPLLKERWCDALTMLESTPSLRDSFTALRVKQERRWGVNNLELPISHLCELDSFSHFLLHIVLHLKEFHDVHNQTLEEYRKVYRIRSKTHPVPELIHFDDGWLEAPFWVWKTGDQQRQRLRVQQNADSFSLSNGENVIATFPVTHEGETTSALAALKELSEQGWKIRTRALTTTLFSRLCFADLFVHGIGGAKYDELTDQIICRFFKLPAPAFSTVSATLFLPLAKPFDVSTKEKTSIKNKLRDLHYNPNRHYEIGDNSCIDQLVEEKNDLVHQQANRTMAGLSRTERRSLTSENRNRYQRFKEIRNKLANCAADQVKQLQEESDKIHHQLSANRILKNREFSFALYPPETLSEFLTHLE